MNKKIQPITALRDTAKLERDLEDNDGLIHITKNGYSSLVILSPDKYDELVRSGHKEVKENGTVHVDNQYIERPQSDPLGFVRVKCDTIKVKVGAINHNKDLIIKKAKEAAAEETDILILPELCLTAYTCGDLFLNDGILDDVEKSIDEITEKTKELNLLLAYGAPLRKGNSLYNCAVLSVAGKIIGVVPKSFVPNYSEFYEARHFKEAPNGNDYIFINGRKYPFGKNLLFIDEDYLKLKIGVEICEDLWVGDTPSTKLALNGANVILNLSSSNETIGKDSYRRDLVRMTSARLRCAYCYSDSGNGESTTDLVFGGHNIVAEDGSLLAESKLFDMEAATADIDLEKINSSRLKATTFETRNDGDIDTIYFHLPIEKKSKLLRKYSKNPFIPSSNQIDLGRVKAILDIQKMGLCKRLEAINCKKAIIGLSGGLDSTLALLVTVEAFKTLGYDLKGIEAITMPAFGTSKRTHDNAVKLSSDLGVSFREINVKESVLKHLEDIGHDLDNHNVAYENAQARERTQVLMDVANDEGALMIGTGDLSELCLGWCTYNGDHMSMYGVNASIPKTLVRYICHGYALLHPEAKEALEDIIDTPISPELLPTDDKGQIAQYTEDTVGPYELNDFFIYHYLRFGYRPKKMLYIADAAYEGKYDHETIKKWLIKFYKRFYANQFKRSCLPDGAKVGSVAISPRGDWRMPSDASSEDAIAELENL